MIEFKEFDGFVESWDDELVKFTDASFEQTFSYGEFLRDTKSNIIRIILLENNKVIVMGQFLVQKTFFGLYIITIRGGPAYQSNWSISLNQKNLKLFFEKVIEYFKSKYYFFYLNSIFYSEHSIATEITLREAGMQLPFFERNPYYTYIVEVYPEEKKNFENLNSKWRNQLRRAEKYKYNFICGNESAYIDIYLKIHNEMCEIKSIPMQKLTYDYLWKMHNRFPNNMFFLILESEGSPVSGCVIIKYKNRAFYFYASANEKGRKFYFSNLMIFILLARLREDKINYLDLMGFDPVKNWGGYHFKRGVGGEVFKQIGEWDFSSHQFIKFFMNSALYWKSKLLFG
jgi:lipid II:glycine glycyltransferase (peptidoglycan interpeptide bridge formation enzyme)